MWRLLDKPKTVKVTKKLAKEFSEMDAAPHDRPLSERRLQVYRRILKEDGFRPVSWASAICKETEGLYRVNGKHTSTMLANMDVIPEFYAVIEEYECDTLEDVAKLYATFDSSTQSRTARDIYMSFAACVPKLRGVAARTIGNAVTGMSYYLGIGIDGKRNQAAERAELLLEYPEFVVWLSKLFSSVTAGEAARQRSDSGHLQRGPVCAAIFGTYLKAKERALEFWTEVRDETGDTPNLPTRKLARYLLTVGVDTGGGSKRLRPVPPREMYVKCLHAWNAWRKGDNTELKYHPDKDVPAIK